MKIKLYQFVNFMINSDKVMNVNMPLKGAWKVNKIRRMAEEENHFYNDQFNMILKTFAEHDEDGNFVYAEDGKSVIIPKDKVDECNQKLEELQNLDIEFNETYILHFEDLGDGIMCTPEQMSALDPFIVF